MVDYDKFQELNVQLLGIGASHPFSQKMLSDSLQLSYPLLSDAAGLKVIRDYGVLSSSGTYADRYFFLIDQQGIIRGRWRGQNTGVFANEPLLEAAQEILAAP